MGFEDDALESPEPACKCGAGQNPANPRRCTRGHTWVGWPGPATVVPEHTAKFWAEAEAERRERVEALLADQGHTAEDAPRALATVTAGLVQAEIVRDSAFLRMAKAGGPLSASGRQRRAFAVWSAAADKALRHAQALGLGRAAKDISLKDYIGD